MDPGCLAAIVSRRKVIKAVPSAIFSVPLSLRMVEEMLAARGVCVT